MSGVRTAVFGYGSLVDRASASLTLGREVTEIWPARLPGMRRRFSQARANLRCEKTFARADDGRRPEWILGLNLEPGDDPAQAPNGALVEVSEGELQRLDLREVRYDRIAVEVDPSEFPGAPRFAQVVTYVAKPEHLALEPPPGAVILSSYAAAVETAFARLGSEQLGEYRRTTLPLPVELIDAVLVEDRIPAGNPREW